MELRDLRSFLTVARCGSFTAAAVELGYTQSAVSQQVAALEVQVGQRLVDRRPVRLTAAGERLAEHAARILLRVDVARSELAHLGHGPQRLVLAVCPLAAPWLLAAALRDLRSTTPGLKVTVRSIEPAQAVAEVASGKVDAALVDGIVSPGEPLSLVDAGLLSSSPLVESPVVVALAAGHPLAGRVIIDLDALADAPWISAPALAGYHPGPLWRSGSEARPGVVYEGSDVPTLLALVAAGHGAVIVPAPACEGVTGIASVTVGQPSLVHRTELLTLRGPPAHLNALVSALRSRAPVYQDRTPGGGAPAE